MIKGFWGKKIGMTQVFTGNKAIPVTVIDVSRWFITDIKTQERDGYQAVQVARVRKRYEGNDFNADWLKSKKQFFLTVREIRCTEPVQDVQVGSEVNFHENFEEGSFVDVAGISKGCGFAGVMRRHNFSGGRGSHGDTMGRNTGSIGFMCACGKVIKGKKMPGHMGVTRHTIENLKLVKVEKDSKAILVKGSIPGKAGSMVFVRSGIKG